MTDTAEQHEQAYSVEGIIAALRDYSQSRQYPETWKRTLRAAAQIMEELVQRVRPDADSMFIEAVSGVSTQDGQPYVQINLGGKVAQLPPNDAMLLAQSIMEAAQAAKLDASFIRFAREQLGVTEAEAASLLYHMRQFRQDAQKPPTA